MFFEEDVIGADQLGSYEFLTSTRRHLIGGWTDSLIALEVVAGCTGVGHVL